ncbi:MAG: hypothetical protein WC437_01645 [Patescibacteria group bacterium]
MMKIKPYLKNKKRLSIVAASIVVLGLLGGGGLYLSQSKGNELNKTNEKANSNQAANNDQQTPENLKGKENTQNTTPNVTIPSTQNNQPATTPLVLMDVSIQAIKSPDGSISLSLYGSQGVYDVEKYASYQSGQCSSGWVLKVSGQNYSGHGGLSIETINASEGNPSYTVYKIVNGKRVSTSKPITINTASIVDTKTFIGE